MLFDLGCLFLIPVRRVAFFEPRQIELCESYVGHNVPPLERLQCKKHLPFVLSISERFGASVNQPFQSLSAGELRESLTSFITELIRAPDGKVATHPEGDSIERAPPRNSRAKCGETSSGLIGKWG